MSKMNLTEATMLALQGKLVENKPTRRKVENIDINVDDKTNVSVSEEETIVDTDKATIIVDKKEDEFVPETSDDNIENELPVDNIEPEVDSVEVPLEGDETIIPEEVADETPVDEPIADDSVSDDVDLPLEDDTEKVEHKSLRREVKEIKKETKKITEAEDITKLPNERGICPFCGSENLDYASIKFEGDMAYFPWECKDCNHQGEEWYELKFAGHNVFDENGDSIELQESKKITEDMDITPFRNMLYATIDDDIDDPKEVADRLIRAWSEDDCKWYCETYEVVTVLDDATNDRYYKDLWGNIRDITGQIVEDDNDLEEAKHRKIEALKKIESRISKKVECNKVCKDNKCEEDCKKEDVVETKDIDTKSFNEALKRYLKVEKVEKAKVIENNGKLLMKAKITNENKARGICLEMKEISTKNNFTKYSVQEVKSIKTESKASSTKGTMLVGTKNNTLSCKYIIKK
jgi:hypothetical protein